jgi:glycosyltransferase involved in cell wall biosynthesis
LRKIKPDIIHTHTSKAGLVGRIAARIASPHSIVLHTFHGHLLYGYFSPLKTRSVVFFEKFLVKFTDVLIAVSSQIETDLKNVGIGLDGRWEIIHPGVNKVERHPFLATRENYKEFLWIGRFTDIKNPILAIDIIKSLGDVNESQIRLIMVGDGELLSEMKSIAVEQKLPIEFAGWQTDIYPYLKRVDALLLTSKNEGLPIVMLEAASMGIPTFSTDVGGVKEFIEDGSSGFLIKNTPDEAAEYILRIILDVGLMTDVSAGAFKKYNSGFSMDYFVKSHFQLYKSLID